VYDTKGAAVAEFDVPHTNPATLPVWKPEALPATKKVDDLDVTLAGLAVEPNEYVEGTRKRTRYTVKPELRIAQDGQVEATPSLREFEFEDVFGNPGYQWDCRLNFNEPAWKLKIKLWPAERASSKPGGEWSVSGVVLPAATQVSLVRQNKVVDGVTVEFVAAGGTGKVVYTETAPASSGNGSSSSGGSFGESSYNIETRTSGGMATTSVDCKAPHLLLRVTGIGLDRRLAVRVHDDQDRNVPVHEVNTALQMIVFLNPAADAKSLNVTFAVQQPKKVEFFVKPPRVERKPEPLKK